MRYTQHRRKKHVIMPLRAKVWSQMRAASSRERVAIADRYNSTLHAWKSRAGRAKEQERARRRAANMAWLNSLPEDQRRLYAAIIGGGSLFRRIANAYHCVKRGF